MLLALRISSFAVIEQVEVAFGPGLTVLTGETGAGKSILVDALSLLLGGRADPEVIRAGSDEASIEGVFARTNLMAARLEELGLPDLGDEVSVRRVIGRNGRGKAYVNGALVTVGVLGRLMKGLVDIAGQHEHMSLFDPSLHRALVDRVGGLAEPLARYREQYAALKAVEQRIAELGFGSEEQAAQKLEFLSFQLDEIDRWAMSPAEEQALELERRRLVASEKLQRASREAEAAISSDEGSALERVDRALALVQEALKVDPGLADVARALQAARSELDDASRALLRYADSVESDPQRLAEVDERLDALERLCRKHGCDVEGLLEKKADLAAEHDRLAHRREWLDKLEAERNEVHARVAEAASVLSRARGAAASGFADAVKQGLAHLAMQKCVFEVRLEPEPFGPDGADRVELFFSANPGEPARPLAKVASGGEASRVMLALKRALAGSDECACYVLDEADAGVGGAVADVVGRMIKEVSAHRQVLCITHLPQVAAHADAHLLILKEERKGRTQSRVQPLDGEGRRLELARMLSGVEVSKEALSAAEALMRSAVRSLRRTAHAASRERGKQARQSA